MIPPKDLIKNYTFGILFFENKYGNDSTSLPYHIELLVFTLRTRQWS